MNKTEELRYKRARKKVKELKGFYIHLLVYLVFLALALFSSQMLNHSPVEISIWGMGLWGVGLLAHGCSVFIPNFLLGGQWQERKIKEIMDKEKREF